MNNEKEIIVEFEKIGHNGASIGKYNNKIVFTYGILPGERAKVRIIKTKKNFIEGEVIEVLRKSIYRIKERENHYISCSPWQVFDYKFQVELKKKILKEIFHDFAKKEIELDNFFESPNIFNYRTKIEFCFLKEDDKFFLAFHKRNNYKEKVKVENGCCLIDDRANKSAFKILDIINQEKIENLKSLIIRKSFSYDDLHISLLTTEKQNFEVEKYNLDELTGFIYAYSTPKSPASVFTQVLKSIGKEYLREKILEMEFRYHYASFFQNNIKLFEKALSIMQENCQDYKKIVDLYCGVGVIGLSLKDFSKKIIGIDSDKNAIHYANLNANLNNIHNFEGIIVLSEKINMEILKHTDLLILDPPRSGLHKRVISLILKLKPSKIFYLSCNPITQARDYFLIKEFYNIDKIYGFDFYPNTPHIENLLILIKKK